MSSELKKCSDFIEKNILFKDESLDSLWKYLYFLNYWFYKQEQENNISLQVYSPEMKACATILYFYKLENIYGDNPPLFLIQSTLAGIYPPSIKPTEKAVRISLDLTNKLYKFVGGKVQIPQSPFKIMETHVKVSDFSSNDKYDEYMFYCKRFIVDIAKSDIVRKYKIQDIVDSILCIVNNLVSENMKTKKCNTINKELLQELSKYYKNTHQNNQKNSCVF